MVRTDPGSLSGTTVPRIDRRGNPAAGTGSVGVITGTDQAISPASTAGARPAVHIGRAAAAVGSALDQPVHRCAQPGRRRVRVAGPARRIAVENNSCGALSLFWAAAHFTAPARTENSGPVLLPRYLRDAIAGIRSNTLALPRCGAGMHGRGKPPPNVNLEPVQPLTGHRRDRTSAGAGRRRAGRPCLAV